MKVFWRLLPALGLVALVLVAFPVIAAADNCGGLSDCWQTALGGALAAAGLGGLAAAFGLPQPQSQLDKDLAQAAKEAGQMNDQGGLQQWFGNVNPNHSGVNCGHTSDMVDRMLGGDKLGPVYESMDGSNDDIAASHPGSSWDYGKSAGDISKDLPNHGDRGIVYVDWGPGNSAHVFNAVNWNGTVYYIDGQTGRVSPDMGTAVTGTDGRADLGWLKTYPP